MENEVWRDVVGYEGSYMVSNYGRVFTNIRDRLMNLSDDGHGYFMVSLSNCGKRKNKKVHVMVAESFIDPHYREKGLVVNHKDFNRKNNYLSNLEVVTFRENTNKKHIKSSSDYVGVSFNKQTNKWKSAIEINGKELFLGYFECEVEASEYYQSALSCIKEGNIDNIVIKRRKSISKRFGKVILNGY